MVFSGYRSKKHLWAIFVTLILTSFQLVRIVSFVSIYGGVEHDSGWFLSISRSLAEQGTYTTMVSTIVNPTVVGDINIDQKFNIQAPDGRIWFFAGNGNGPISIVANAIVLKIFGTEFWALRAGPLIFYTLFLLLAAYLLYRLAGSWAIILFNAFLIFYPHISVFLGYEAAGEVPGMFFVLLAYVAFLAATQKQHRRWLYFFIAGLVIALAINTKLITLWSVSGIFAWAGLLWLISMAQRNDKNVSNKGDSRWLVIGGWRLARLNVSELFFLGLGLPLSLVLWELVHLVILTRLAGLEMYLQQAHQRLMFILDDGSGVGLRIYSGSEFLGDKFFLLGEVAHPQRWVTAVIFMAIVLGTLYLLWYWRTRPVKQNLLMPMWFGWLVHMVWFVIIAKTGWLRHAWFALVLATMLLSVVTVMLLRGTITIKGTARREFGIYSALPKLAGGLLLLLIGCGFISQPYVGGIYLPDEIIPYWQEKQINSKYGANLPWIIIPREAQAETVAYLQQLSPQAKIYYPAQHKAAEISALSGRVLYPLNRRQYVRAHPQDVVLVSPTLIAPWMDPVRRAALLSLVQEDCPEPILANDYYMICPLP
jgi:hypothetical protein